MLVISRKVGESFVIADNIRISILASGNDKVSVGIEAPPEIKVVRTELAETIRADENPFPKWRTRISAELRTFSKTKAR